MTTPHPRPTMRALAFAAFTLTASGAALAQTPAPSSAAPAHPMTRVERSDAMRFAPLTTFHLHYVTAPNDANELLTGLRLMLDPDVKLYLLTHDNTIMMRGLPDDIALATHMVNELDRPRDTYRLTFTVSQFDGTRKLGSSDYTMTLLDGQRSTLKQGLRIPVQTGRYDVSSTVSESQMTYLDIGLSFDATLNSNGSGATLREKVEQSSLPDGQTTPASNDPTLHQTVMEGVTSLQLGRTTSLGTLDSVGPNRRTEVDVKLEKLP